MESSNSSEVLFVFVYFVVVVCMCVRMCVFARDILRDGNIGIFKGKGCVKA